MEAKVMRAAECWVCPPIGEQDWTSFRDWVDKARKRLLLRHPQDRLVVRMAENYGMISDKESYTAALVLFFAQVLSMAEIDKHLKSLPKEPRQTEEVQDDSPSKDKDKDQDKDKETTKERKEDGEKDEDKKEVVVEEGEERDEAVLLGLMYVHGCGLPRSRRKAMLLLHLACVKENSAGLTALGRWLMHTEIRKQQQLQQLQQPQQATTPTTTEQNQGMINAVGLFMRAAVRKNPEALVKLASYYEEGLPEAGIAKDLEKARQYYEMASDIGFSEADHNLAQLYEGGVGVPADLQKALRYYMKAAARGHEGSQCNLGVMYEKGRGVEPDPRKAFEMYKKGAAQGHMLACYNLALMYEKAKGGVVEKNERKAFKLFLKSARQGYDEAELKVAYMYSIGRGVKQDDREASEWYMKTVMKSHAFAISNLGSLYIKGRGVPCDMAKAYQLLRLAAGRGNRRAVSWLNSNPAQPLVQGNS